MDKSALKKVVKVENSQIRWPTELEDQFIRAKIIKLLLQALMARNIWEAMEYLMAARGLLKSYHTSVSITHHQKWENE